jgi:hypothetical protein
MAEADGLGKNSPRDVGVAWGGGAVARGLVPAAAEVTMMSAIHSLR